MVLVRGGAQRVFALELRVEDRVAARETHHRPVPLAIGREVDRCVRRIFRNKHVRTEGQALSVVTRHALIRGEEMLGRRRRRARRNHVIERYRRQLDDTLEGDTLDGVKGLKKRLAGLLEGLDSPLNGAKPPSSRRETLQRVDCRGGALYEGKRYAVPPPLSLGVDHEVSLPSTAGRVAKASTDDYRSGS